MPSGGGSLLGRTRRVARVQSLRFGVVRRHPGTVPDMARARGLHHVEIWVADIDRARSSWGWLLPRLGFERDGEWDEGTTWRVADTYLTITTSPNLAGDRHDRRRPGVNHLAFHGGSTEDVDRILDEASAGGWTPLYHERYPHAGGPDHYAGWVQNAEGFKVEIVATEAVEPSTS